MKIAFIMFDNFTFLDLIGFYDCVTRLKTMGFKEDLSWDMCAMSETLNDDRGLSINATKINTKLDAYDMLFIPGGMGTRTLQHDPSFINWIKTAQNTKLKVSVCTGSLILGAAGFLKDKKATTHTNALEELSQYCLSVEKERIVDEGSVITGAGVATSIDLGLYICERLSSTEVRNKIAKQMDYPYQY
ncbi:MAG: DJ-1/PfpI family protein [Campylobacteraceae bacterium]|nr:DJ-1/PfpI family protein [Campylobacteraceae bacterium]